jgi:hypothetical protein
LGLPLLGFDPPSRCDPKFPPAASRPGAPLLGFPSPSTLEEKRVHGRPCGSSPSVARGSAAGSHADDYGAAHRFSQPLSDFFLASPSRHFQAGGVPGVRSSGVRASYEDPTARHRRHALLTLFPRIARVPDLGGDVRGRVSRFPRMTDSIAFCRLQGLHPRRNRSAARERLSTRARPSPHELAPPHGVAPADEPGFRPAAVTLRSHPVRRQIDRELRSTACRPRE